MPYRPSTYTLAWEALRLYREAMREFVIENLQREYKDLWMAQGVEKHFPLEQIDDLQRILGQRKMAAVVSAQAESMEDMLDISHFKHIIVSNWKPVFEKVLGDKTIVDSWIAEITAARNALAHWTGGDMPRKDAMRVVDTCERVVRSISPERADDLLAIWQSLDMMGREGTLDARRATIAFEDGDAPKRATVIFDEPAHGTKPSAKTKARRKHPRAYEAWTGEEEAQLLELARSGGNMKSIAKALGRQPSAIRSRLVRLGWDGVQD